MPIWRCQKCNQTQAYPKHNNEFNHECTTGNAALDNVTLLNLDSPTWNYQGINNKSQGTTAGFLGYDTEDVDERGFRKSTTKTRANIINVIAKPYPRNSNITKHPR